MWIYNPINQKLIVSELNQGIWDIFDREKIEIPFPQRDSHIRNIASGKQLLPLNRKSE